MSKVYIIGAGPGDEELLTLKAIKSMEKCTAVLYDRLVGNNILNYLREDCKIFYCGKEPGCHYKSQDEINSMLVKLAKEGHIVGRVKGGDPYVFGRGGEEVLSLVEEGIDFEVIPGVTSAISVMSYAGIPTTHRGISQSFHVITGMSGSALKVNWEGVSKLEGTLIFLMGLENIEYICSSLVSQGKDMDTPCGVIMRGTTSKQRKVVGTLENICERVEDAGLKSPCIIVVGNVVTLNDKLNWFEGKPLFGLNVCVTRSKEQARSLKYNLKELGAEVTEINAIKIKDTALNLEEYENKFSKYDFIVLTSVNAVNIFFDYLRKREIDLRVLKGRFAVIGEATAGALKDKGIKPFIIAKEFVSESLVESMKLVVKEGDKILVPCSKESRLYIGEELKKLGAQVDRVEIYEPICGDIKNVNAFNEVDIVTFTSPSIVRNMIKLVGAEELKKKLCVAIGPITFKELENNGISAVQCKKYGEDGLISELLTIWRNKNAL
ncbi:uroporphyrinogen-III C-methyltransferase [Inconstantimicrobium mannanitabidum]|uniref:Uroporphyrinogen-III C-methyltransferase n=1 Tax=Inconstantimicrobium mannanitabidum TaxID=1604901 RepID=A0ACB5RG10_9CLOT|nr:uroporphyrinogen-III C-methyltransferase [Clostridium sp. TW13]GKX67988.1 uroporphyrinogen-III C-methyltransferase [Clostridium sp. TW13]